MDYRVEELATAAGVRVDTIRFYQGRGLLPPPRRAGRIAVYTDHHLERLREIRTRMQQGFTLAQIRRMEGEQVRAEHASSSAPDHLLSALVEEQVGDRSYSLTELAEEAGVPEALILAARAAGLFEPIVVAGEDRYTPSDLQMARAALAILGAGFPLNELLDLAVTHARNVQSVSDRAIDLFDDHVRKAGQGANDGEATAEAFKSMLPQVAKLVALHFQRTLVTRALDRLRSSGDDEALEQALAVAESGQLEVAWR